MLTVPRLVVRNLVYHWRGNLAVMLGVAVGSAVLTGALLVGDSLRGSLRASRAATWWDRLRGAIPEALRADVVDGLPGRVAPVLMLPGSLQAGPAQNPNGTFLGRVTVIGVDDRFKPVETSALDWNGDDKKLVVSDGVASRLGVGPGDRVTLGVERFSDLPRSSSIARRTASDATATEEFVVAAILPDESPGNDFNLTPNPATPLNVFVPLRSLARLASGDRDPIANVLLASGQNLDDLGTSLRDQLRIEDYGLKIREIGRKGYLSVESDQLILPSATVAAVKNTAKDLGVRAEPTIAYIADALAHGNRSIPYPVIASLNPTAPAPLGPFLPAGVASLVDDEIVLLDWPDSELNGLPIGSKIRLDYFNPEVEGTGELRAVELSLRGYIRLDGAAHDRDLVPEIRGVTDPRANLHDWDRPPVLPKEKIRARVPDKPPHPRGTFFNTYKATPMAYLNLATGEKLFGSRYGSVTSIRLAPHSGISLEQTAEQLRPALLNRLDPRSSGLAFDGVRARLLTASRGGTDFGGLFLGFSLFLIVSSLVLVGLLFRLALDRRGAEVGLLLAAGYRVRTVQRLLLMEGLTVATLGAAMGLALGLAYNRLLLALLVHLWPDRAVVNLLRPHATSLTFALGFGLTIAMSAAALWLSLRWLVRVPPPSLLRGETQRASNLVKQRSRSLTWACIACATLGVSLVVVGRFLTSNPDYLAMTFFAGGGLCLISGLGAAWLWLRRTRHHVVNGRGVQALGLLGIRNAARNPIRSLLTMALLASAAFLLVAVESFRRQSGNEFLDVTGGSGGFNLIAETDVPLYQSFADPLGRKELETQLNNAGDWDG